MRKQSNGLRQPSSISAGKSHAEIEPDFGWTEQTVYGLLNRFEERDFEDALYNDKPPGKNPNYPTSNSSS